MKSTLIHLNLNIQFEIKTFKTINNGFSRLAKTINVPILGAGKYFECNDFGFTMNEYNKVTHLTNEKEVVQLSKHLANALVSTDNNGISDCLFEIYTEEPIVDVEGNEVSIIDMYLNTKNINGEIDSTTRFCLEKDNSPEIIETDILEFTNIVLKKETFLNIGDEVISNISNIINEFTYIKNIQFDLKNDKTFIITIEEKSNVIDIEKILNNIKRLTNGSNLNDKISFKVILKNNLYDNNNNRINEIVFNGKKAEDIECYTGYRNKKITTLK